MRSTNRLSTPEECLFHEALMRAMLSFETQSHPGKLKFEADIELSQAPIVIEVAENPERQHQASGQPKTLAFQNLGYRVYWFSNKQAKEADTYVQQVVEENGLLPELIPTFNIRSYRIGFSKSSDEVWEGEPPTLFCEQCGTSFLVSRYRGKMARFCSYNCYWSWMGGHPECAEKKRLQRDWSELPKMREVGMSAHQIAEFYSCSRTAVENAMRRMELPMRPQGGYRPKGGFYQTDHDMIRSAVDDKAAELGRNDPTSYEIHAK